MKHWPILISFGTQHREETWRKWQHNFAHLTLLLFLHYLAKFRSDILEVFEKNKSGLFFKTLCRYCTPLLKWISEYAVRAYTTPDSAASFLNHAWIAVTTLLFAFWRTTAAKNCENRSSANEVWIIETLLLSSVLFYGPRSTQPGHLSVGQRNWRFYVILLSKHFALCQFPLNGQKTEKIFVLIWT